MILKGMYETATPDQKPPDEVSHQHTLFFDGAESDDSCLAIHDQR